VSPESEESEAIVLSARFQRGFAVAFHVSVDCVPARRENGALEGSVLILIHHAEARLGAAPGGVR